MFDFLKTAKWNNEPNQKKLATMLWEAATYEVTRGAQGKSLNIPEWAAFTRNCGWSDREASNRFIHAVTMIKPMVDARTYEAAKQMAHNLYEAWRA
jgi:hypothetical protein